jgi:hypothetical protein
MNQSRRLYELQQIDLLIDDKERELAQVQEQMGDSQAILELRQEIATAQHGIAELEKRRKELEWEAKDLSTKIASLEEQLYSGRTRNPKELMALQQDAGLLKGKRQAVEDSELEVMLELEELQGLLREKGLELAEREKGWREEQERLAAQEKRLKGELEDLGGQRDSLAQQVNREAMEFYENIRAKRRGVAVVLVERGTCGGCRIAVPAIEMQRARMSGELVFCQSCGRILFIP